MKKLILISIVFIQHVVFSQNPAPFPSGLKLINATEVDSTTFMPVINSDKEIANYINIAKIFPKTLQSITGTNVTLTDPLNPIVNIPSLHQITSVGNRTSNKILIKRGTGAYTGSNTDLFIETDETLTGTTVSNWVEANRTVSAGFLDLMYGQVVRANNKSTTDIGKVVGSEIIARNSSTGNVVKELVGFKAKGESLGAGSVNIVSGLDVQSRLKGPGDVKQFMLGATISAWHTGTGEVNEIRGFSTSTKLNNPAAKVTDIQGGYMHLGLHAGEVKRDATVLYLDFKTNRATTKIKRNFTYIEAGKNEEDSIKACGVKRFIWYAGKLDSDFGGVINVLKPISAIDSASNKVLITKEYLEHKRLVYRDTFAIKPNPYAISQGSFRINKGELQQQDVSTGDWYALLIMDGKIVLQKLKN